MNIINVFALLLTKFRRVSFFSYFSTNSFYDMGTQVTKILLIISN